MNLCRGRYFVVLLSCYSTWILFCLFFSSSVSASGLSLNMGLNIVFIVGCLLACGVVIYRSRRSNAKYQPLPTSETDWRPRSHFDSQQSVCFCLFWGVLLMVWIIVTQSTVWKSYFHRLRQREAHSVWMSLYRCYSAPQLLWKLEI